MDWKRRLRAVAVCAILECGALAGVPMRVEQIVALLESFARPTVAHVLPDESGGGAKGPDPE